MSRLANSRTTGHRRAVVMAAVAVHASCLVTSDGDPLSLQKPCGAAGITPRDFLGVILRQP
jgi:hypothetical protein